MRFNVYKPFAGGIRVWFLAGIVLLAMSLSACDDGGDMRDSPRYEPLEQSVLPGRLASARTPPVGTIAQDDWVDNRPLHTGLNDQAGFVKHLPMRIDAKLLRRGRERYTIFCTPCHGQAGDGDGIVPARGYTPPPSFHIDRLRQAPAGYLYSVITHGAGRMPSYASQVPTRDRWAIIAYLRALQWSRDVPVQQLSDDDRRQLDPPPANADGGRTE